MDLELSEAPEDWRAPLAEIGRDTHEAWENTAEPGGDDMPSSAEEWWEPQMIENLDEGSFT